MRTRRAARPTQQPDRTGHEPAPSMRARPTGTCYPALKIVSRVTRNGGEPSRTRLLVAAVPAATNMVNTAVIGMGKCAVSAPSPRFLEELQGDCGKKWPR